MRARDNRHRADELAAVVRWLRARAGELITVADRIVSGDKPVPTVAFVMVGEIRAKAAALHEAAAALDRGEHHGQS